MGAFRSCLVLSAYCQLFSAVRSRLPLFEIRSKQMVTGISFCGSSHSSTRAVLDTVAATQYSLAHCQRTQGTPYTTGIPIRAHPIRGGKEVTEESV
jgi:hypothetical protein